MRTIKFKSLKLYVIKLNDLNIATLRIQFSFYMS